MYVTDNIGVQQGLYMSDMFENHGFQVIIRGLRQMHEMKAERTSDLDSCQKNLISDASIMNHYNCALELCGYL